MTTQRTTPRRFKNTTFLHESGYGQLELDASPSGIRRLGKMIKAYREEYFDYTWAALSRCSGIGGATIKALENGVTRTPHFPTVMNILWALGFKTVAIHESQIKQKRTELRKVA